MLPGNPRRAAGAPPVEYAEPPQPIYQHISLYRQTCSDCGNSIPPRTLVTVHGVYTVPNTQRIQCPSCVNSDSVAGGSP